MAPYKSKRSAGPGLLSWAWIGLIVMIGLGAITVLLLPERTEAPKISVKIDDQPERFATAGQDTATIPEAGMATIIPSPAAPSTPKAETSSPASVVSSQPSASPVQQTIIEPNGAKRIILASPAENTPAPTPQDPSRSAQHVQIKVETREDILEEAGPDAALIKVTDLPETGAAKPKSPPPSLAPPAPLASLYYDTAQGPMPVVNADGVTPAEYYRRRNYNPETLPQISILVSGLGLDPDLTQQAINTLPAEISLSFAPYTKNIDQLALQARVQGHETLLEIPMESSGIPTDRFGPAVLKTDYTPQENLQRLDWILTRYAGYVGVTNYFGTAFGSNALAARPIVEKLQNAGLGIFADSDFAPVLHNFNGLKVAPITYIVSPTSPNLLPALQEATLKAQNGRPVLIKIYISPANLSALTEWSKTYDSSKITLAPASSMIQ